MTACVGRAQEVEDASAVFRDRESRRDWQSECAYLRANLGQWLTFRSEIEWRVRSEASIEGSADFAKGQYRIGTSWDLEAGRARPSGLRLYRPDRQPSIALDVQMGLPFPTITHDLPRPSGVHGIPRYTDPPPPNPFGQYGA